MAEASSAHAIVIASVFGRLGNVTLLYRDQHVVAPEQDGEFGSIASSRTGLMGSNTPKADSRPETRCANLRHWWTMLRPS